MCGSCNEWEIVGCCEYVETKVGGCEVPKQLSLFLSVITCVCNRCIVASVSTCCSCCLLYKGMQVFLQQKYNYDIHVSDTLRMRSNVCDITYVIIINITFIFLT